MTATTVQIRRGTNTEHSSFTGAQAEITVNTTNDSVHVHDGSTAGGFELLRADLNNVSASALNTKIDTEIDSYLSAGTGISISSGTISVNIAAFNTDDLTEGSTNLYHTTARARAAVSASGDLSYNSSTGVFSFSETYSSASELLTAVKTVDGSGSGLDADTLDGQQGSYYAPKASPALTGTPTAPTASTGTNTTQIATTAFVQQEINALKALLYAYDQS